ncbi:MAG: hypothetical protein EXS00_00995 [Phycisphaerales bacterium]|nr:hypothetical protein [Phycisphaerales bacterium]
MAIAANSGQNVRLAMTSRPRYILGLMSGTSIDAIDAALVRIEGEGLDLSARLLSHCSHALGDLAPQLRAALRQTPMTTGELTRLCRLLSEFHVQTAERAVALHLARVGDAAAFKVDLAVAHGQTVFHAPPDSWQMFDPFPLAHALGCQVLCGLRGADIAAGGQGAPITPLSDWIMYRAQRKRTIVNLGGFANATVLPARDAQLSEIRGLDICLCNQLLDHAARRVLHTPFDENGRAAQAGSIHPDLLQGLSDLLTAQSASGRSLGTADEGFALVDSFALLCSPNDLMRTLVEAVAVTIVRSIHLNSSGTGKDFECVLAGGGARNQALTAALGAHLSASQPPLMSDQLGIPIEAREAMAMAVLGALAADGLPLTLAQVTGRAPHSTQGLWTRAILT